MSGESIANKLRRLRREGPSEASSVGAASDAASGSNSGASPDASPDANADTTRTPRAADLPAHLTRRLARVAAPSDLAARATTGPPRDLVRRGGAWERVESFALDHRHGAVRLDRVLATEARAIALVAADPTLEAFDPARAVYLDIEATGLSGGSGTYPYLVALARRVDERWELWQGFMATPEEEPALLAEVARRVGGAGQMVSFFGKSYDRHRLEDKMRHHRIDAPFDAVLHLDLYHPLKRLYDGAEANGKLQTHERVLCGFERTDDLSGAYAPMAWFDFVADRPHLLEEVFRHNAADVLSLIGLTAHLGGVLEDESALDGSPAHRARGLARSFARAKEHARAAEWFDRAAERFGDAGASVERLALEGARERERAGEREAAARGYAALVDGADALVAALACERLALLAPRLGRRDEARDWARRGLECVRSARPSNETARLTERLSRRVR